MKTPTATQPFTKAGNNLIGGILLLGSISTIISSIEPAAFSELAAALESQWQNMFHAMYCFAGQPHPNF